MTRQRDDTSPLDHSDDPPTPMVAGIGASAGGLAALKNFFAEVPDDSGLAYVVVMHLSPDRESHLAELLQPHIGVPVQQVTETVRLEPDHVYVIPPNANLNTIDTHLRLSELEERPRQRAPIDHFFRTLARTHDGDAVGVILTGSGSDGTLGLREIKEQGGLTIVQDPAEAEYDGMPQSAIATGLVDVVLPLAEIPRALITFVDTRPQVRIPETDEDVGHHEQQVLPKVLAQIRARTGRDFTHYKHTTTLRRVGRRMQLRGIELSPDYLEVLRDDPDEVRALADDLLITVTSFFRDPEVFEALEQTVIPALLEDKSARDTVRVWSVGCATGEEAYSVAMLLLEAAGRMEAPPRIQVFASDLHEQSLTSARDGFYPGDIASDVKETRLQRFFTEADGGYRIRKEVRELVVFSPHDLLRDPPFSRLDLVTCRNVLIYLDRSIQGDVIDVLHYALQPGGFLVLGTSETVESAELFRIHDKQHCIYERRNVPAPDPRLPVFPLTRTPLPGEPSRAQAEEPVAYGVLHQRIVERYGPPSLLVSADDRVVHLSEHVGRFLVHPGGELTNNVFKLVREELRVELRSALNAAREQRTPVRTKPQQVRFNGETAQVTMDVRPAIEPDHEGYVLVLFTRDELPDGGTAAVAGPPRAAASARDDDAVIRELEDEVDLADQRLQSLIEEYETSQEELRASNEELQSSNEELRSTLEELETSKEELQSMNEELQTVNQEHRHKVDELSQLSGDLQNLLAATDIATLFLDRDLRIMRFTPPVGELFNIRPADRGRPISDLTHRLGYDELWTDGRRVLDRLVPVQREVRDKQGRWYLTRVLPYRNFEDRIDGVVLTFVDITDRKRSEEQVQAARDYAEAIVETLHEPLLVLTPDLRVQSANRAFYEHFQVRRQETLGQRVYDLGNGQWDIALLRTLLEDVLPENNVFEDYEVTHGFESIGERVMLVNGRRLDHVQLILLGIRDITERKRSEEALRASEQRLQRMIDIPGVAVLTFDRAGTLLDANTSFVETFGYSHDEIAARTLSWGDLTPPEYVAASERQLESMDETGTLGPYEKEYVSRDGSRSWLMVAGADLGDGTFVEYCIDIGDRKRAERDLRHLTETLEEQVEERTREVRQLSETLARAEQQERQRLSHLLHGDLQQLLYAIQMKTSLARDAAATGRRDDAVTHTEDDLQLIDDAITRTRQLTVDLNPPILQGEGLLDAVEWLRAQMMGLHGLQVEITAADTIEVSDADVRILLFQVVRELLFNVAKHADTDCATVTATAEDGRVHIVVADNGRGFDATSTHPPTVDRHGLGLLSARERLRMYGGDLEIDANVGGGTRVHVYGPPASST